MQSPVERGNVMAGEMDDLRIMRSIIKTEDIVNQEEYRNIMCSVSGGSDSDVMLDICFRADPDKKVSYVWFDTGLEYQATKEHIRFLEEKYGIHIYREKAVKSIPACCREYGVPFLSKMVSSQISRLQAHGFRWEDLPYEVLLQKYPNCMSALKWWCNMYDHPGYRTSSQFSIGRNKLLKEFIMAHPPWFPISNKCCYYAKKKTSERFIKEKGIDLSLIGVRKAEGGVRAAAYSGCFTPGTEGKVAAYRPLFHYLNSTKEMYDGHYGIVHSRCYTEYGMKRTGCVGCPYNRELLQELAVIGQHEPKLYRAIRTIFRDSYEYTRMYREFVRESQKGGGQKSSVSGKACLI